MKLLIGLLPLTAMLALVPALSRAQGAPDPGAQAFAQCRACHTLQPGAKSAMGPNLHGLFGRQAGSAGGFNNYSPALKASNIRWSEASLDQYLAAPTQKVPGTRMVMRVADPVKRKALIAYLKTETAK